MTEGFNELEGYNLCRFVGQTVTVFTTSGGISGCGFTGVLMSANEYFIRLLTTIGAAPECPVGSNCCPPLGTDDNCNLYGAEGGFGCGLGSVVVIPLDRIVSFTHNAI